jgi:hypothetical protein
MTNGVPAQDSGPIDITQDTDVSLAGNGSDVTVVTDFEVEVIQVPDQGPPGPAGPPGAPGAPGPAGPKGPPGTTLLYGSGAPSNATGNIGDSYIDQVANVLYGPKTATWPAGVPLIGPPGPRGNSVLYGSGAPTSGIGISGDFYIDTVAHFIYGPKTTTWPAGTSLIGPPGPTGAASTVPGPPGPQGPIGVTGPQGPQGVPGTGNATMVVAATAPTGQPDGTLWFETDSGALFVLYNDGTSTQWVETGR